jgi:DNA-binding response OmpR family regulator
VAQILIIDDDVVLLDLLQLHLSGRSVDVQVAEDAVIALRSIIKSPPDLIVLDLGLPYLSGMEVLRAVKGDPKTSHIPVIVVTGHDNEAEHVRARELGADAFLNKPVARDDLINEIFSRLSRQIAGRSATPAP